MLYVDNQNITEPQINLALEEYLLRNYTETFLLFYINEPSIIIGRNQNTLEEINTAYVEDHGVHVVRRLSGGGAVYHDEGNLNFSFITTDAPENFQNFAKFTRPVIQVLHELGVPAELSGRNDILVHGRKISGNAQYQDRINQRMFSHGTLLFDTDLAAVVAALNVSQSKITSKGLKSVRSRVANISEFLTQPLTIQAFKQRILQRIFAEQAEIPTLPLDDKVWEAVHTLVAQRYGTWTWNYGASPDFNVRKRHRFPHGEIDVRVDVRKGYVRGLKIYGDFLGAGNVSDLETCLADTRFNRADVSTALAAYDVRTYLGGITRDDFLALLF